MSFPEMFFECPRCLEEIVSGIDFDEMPEVTIDPLGYKCERHGVILMKDMRPNEKTCKFIGLN